jgi:hypothetical protein
MSAMRRRDVPLLLVVLPDGSRSLIPVSWTDSAATSIADEPAAMSNNHREHSLARLVDFLHARSIVDALLGRISAARPDAATEEENCGATDPGASRDSVSTGNRERSARSRSPRRGT